MSEKGKKKKKSTGLGIAIWILAFLIILIVFLVKQEDIKNNFDKSGASALIEKKIGKDIFEKKDSPKTEESGEIVIDLTKNSKKKEPVAKSEPKKTETVAKTESKKEDSAKKETAQKKSDEKKTEVTLKQTEKSENKTEKALSQENQQAAKKQTDVQNQQPNKEKAVQQKQAPAETKTVTQTQTQAVQTVQPNPPAPQPVANTIKAKICFVAIDSDGPVVRKEVTRSVEKDSPMGDALRMLLAGPSATEAKTGCRSLIPEGTRLLSASVKNGIANLNFSEEFQFNQFGAEGSIAQLMQVVYTATNFSTVKGVQIFIEGQKRDYLTEGVWIGSPLNRSSF
ncbi:GerMN domain-containing protein [uncultured Treponema sp.]|uniref:GerMN domain-containing protein n=1 Tax=uncultured Treponema sp. TaxID=162155 RepID=UPI0025F4B598|nr:GerMN domain-containing protein [uncultured Treponema sp.]